MKQRSDIVGITFRTILLADETLTVFPNPPNLNELKHLKPQTT